MTENPHRSLILSALMSALLGSCGTPANDDQAFSPGAFEGSPSLAISSDTPKNERSTCNNLINLFLSEGRYRLLIEESNDPAFLNVLRETDSGRRQVAIIDKRQTAFGVEEKTNFSVALSSAPEQANCNFTFDGTFYSKTDGSIEENGTMEGLCEDSITSLECVFKHSMTLTPFHK